MVKSESILLTIQNLSKYKKSGIFTQQIFVNDYNWTFNIYKFASGTDILRRKPFKLHSEKNRVREAKSIHKLKKFKQAIELSRYVFVDNILKDMDINMNQDNLPYHLTKRYHKTRYVDNVYFDNAIPIVHSHLEKILGESSILTREKGEECLEQMVSLVFPKIDEFLIKKGVTLDLKLDLEDKKFSY